jgi:hypothetical protein
LAVPEPAAAAMTNLKLLYQLGASLGSSFDVDNVLEVVMDSVFEHVKADHGMILLIDEKSDELIPKIVRTREEPDAKDGKDQPELANDDTAAGLRVDARRSTRHARS